MLRNLFSSALRKNILKSLSTTSAEQVSENKITEILRNKFPESHVKVEDISGGCGAMFEVHIVSNQFKNLSTVKQHQMVNLALKGEVKQMHGIRIFTQAQ
ncbi:CLUMA_CG011768, isoform A [Clunio marinus]|uniref:CLUMA_CG011768, isoform A n=1 Tax=Clunio marinus TaxID=568069 RepID=A0A1J1IF75_9DIPT|nr:CLUMA_CG011768, isoform A [Clunio marinus]